MDKAAVLIIIKRYVEALENIGIKVEKTVLYGSYHNGDYREGSDIDLVVVSDDFAGKGLWERIEILAKALVKVFEPIEAVAMTPDEFENGDSMIAMFAREGEVIV
ncbi:MAG: nucleotidyltransferase domain-containing protein [FCB group bacterium]|nr:nucleotidyltransferase domain-containing protein [FCB group bacterium]